MHNLTPTVIHFPRPSRRPFASRPPVRRTVYGADRIGLVGFHDYAFVIAKPAGAHAAWLQERTQQLHRKVGGSGTNIAQGLRKAVDLLRPARRGVLRRIWLLSDGYPNRDVGAIDAAVAYAREQRVNVNTVGFGDLYDGVRLRDISGATHNGKFVPVRTLEQLTDALVRGASGRNGNGSGRTRHRAENTVLAIDLSPSMGGPMGRTSKVAVVEQAILHLLHYKQQLFS